MNYGERLVVELNRYRFARTVRGMLETAPVVLDGSGPIVLSMIQHRDVHAALLACKSLLRFVPARRLVVIADPSMTPADRGLLRRHFPGVEIREAREFQHADLPQGGTWERLAAIAEYVSEAFVIQLDADTVALAPLPEVTAAVATATAFTLGTADHQQAQSCAAAVAEARERMRAEAHIQLLAESRLDQLEGAEALRYVRGCSGFAGYPQGSFDPARLRELSRRLAALLGPRWREWGTEQFTSNLLLASMPGFKVLPHPRYCAPPRQTADTVFLHFIGYVRYASGLYASVCRDVVADLRGPASARSRA